jgi:hypothetical protein
MVNLSKMQTDATTQIRRWGNGTKAKIWRAGAVRVTQFAAISDWRPAERALREDGAVRMLVAAPINPPIEYKLDEIEFAGVKYRITAPVTGGMPDGVTRIKFDLECMEGSAQDG